MDQNIIAGVFAAFWLAGSLPVSLRDWSFGSHHWTVDEHTGRNLTLNMEVINEWTSVEHETLMGETNHQRSPDGGLTVWPSHSSVVRTAKRHPEDLHEQTGALPLQHWNVQLYPYRNWFVPQPEGDSGVDCFIKPYLQRTTTGWTWHEGRVSRAGVLCK